MKHDEARNVKHQFDENETLRAFERRAARFRGKLVRGTPFKTSRRSFETRFEGLTMNAPECAENLSAEAPKTVSPAGSSMREFRTLQRSRFSLRYPSVREIPNPCRYLEPRISMIPHGDIRALLVSLTIRINHGNTATSPLRQNGSLAGKANGLQSSIH